MYGYLLLVFLAICITTTHSILACKCDSTGSYSNICDPKTGQCHCKPSFGGRKCNQCKQPGLTFPDCNDANQSCHCDLAGTKTDFERNGACVDRVSTVFFVKVKYFWNAILCLL